MKIVITVENFSTQKRYLEFYLAKEFANMNHEAYVITFGSKNELCEETHSNGFEIIRLPHLGTFNGLHLLHPSSISHIKQFMDQTKPNVIHCQPLFSPLSLLLSFLAAGNTALVGSMITGPYSLNTLDQLIKHYFLRFFSSKYLKKRVDLVFAKTPMLGNLVSEMYCIPSQKIEIIPLGADPEFFSFTQKGRNYFRSKLGLARDDLVILCSGHLRESRNFHDLLQAVAPIMKDYSNVKLVIKGGGDKRYENSLKEFCADLGIEEDVVFYPWIDIDDLPRFYSACDISVWPSGESISMVETASVGLPLISSTTPIESYALTESNALTYSSGDINGLRDCIRLLVDKPEKRDNMSNESRLLVENKLNWNNIGNQYLREYRRVIERHATDELISRNQDETVSSS